MIGKVVTMVMAASLVLGNITTKHFDEYVPRDPWDNVAYRSEMLKLAASDRAASEQIKVMCSEDPLFYINTFSYSFSPKDSIYGDPRTPFTLYDMQCETILGLLDCINVGLDCATPKSRGVGASYLGLSAIEWAWHFRDMLSFLMVSRKQDLVDDTGNDAALFWKIDYLHRYQPKWLLPTGRWLGNKDPNRKLLRLVNADNDSIISGTATGENISVGGRHTCIFFDEFALLDNGYSVITGSRDVTNCRIWNSTPRGQNHFYEVCENVAARVYRLHWSRHDVFSKGLYTKDENGKVELLDNFKGFVRYRDKGDKEPRQVMFPDDYPFQSCNKFKRRSPWFDYECTRCASEKEIGQELEIDFLGSEYQFFDSEEIHMLKKKHCMSPLLVGDIEFDPITFELKRFREDVHGNLKLWITLDGEGRIASDRKFAIGSDVSAGTGASNSCSCIVDRDTGEKVGVWKNSHTLPHLFAGVAMALGKWFNKAHMVYDRSGPTGEVFNKVVVKHGYGNVYYRRNEKKIGRKITDEPGVFLNPVAKSVILHDYRDAISFSRYINRSETGMDECLQFIKHPDGSVEHSAAMNSEDPDGARTAHGDEVIADALACLGMTDKQETKTPDDNNDVPVGCLAWRMQMKRDAESSKNSDNLGEGW